MNALKEDIRNKPSEFIVVWINGYGRAESMIATLEHLEKWNIHEKTKQALRSATKGQLINDIHEPIEYAGYIAI